MSGRFLSQRILEGECKLVHIDGASMPADFMTKKVEQKKVDSSIAYVRLKRAQRRRAAGEVSGLNGTDKPTAGVQPASSGEGARRREGPATYSRANDGEHWTDSK